MNRIIGKFDFFNRSSKINKKIDERVKTTQRKSLEDVNRKISSFERIEVALNWKAKSRCEFYELLADFIADGVPVYEAVQDIHERFVAIKDPKRHLTRTIIADLRGGGGKVLSLGESLKKFSPSLESMAIESGEQSSGVEKGLRMAAELARINANIKKTLVSELTYPAILLAMLAGFLLALSGILLPVFEELMPREAWPFWPSLLGDLADSSTMIVASCFSFLTLIVVIFSITKARWIGKSRDFMDTHIAPWSINRRMTGAIFMSCFSELITAGIPFSSVIDKLMRTATPWEESHLLKMRAILRKGKFEGEAMASSLFDSELRWKIEVYGKRTNFAKTLGSLSKQVLESTTIRLRRFANWIRMGVYLLMTAMLAWVYASFLDLSFSAQASLQTF